MTNSSKMKQLKELHLFWKRHGRAILAYGLVPVPDGSTGVGANTYRAYGTFVKRNADKIPRNKPSDLFNGWAKKQFKKCNLATASDFYKFHARARQSLATYWKNDAKTDIEVFPYACKLIDLHVKHIVWHRLNISASQRARLLRLAYQPLDQYSLLLLRQLGEMRSNGKPIPEKASMGLVNNEVEYLHFQTKIREVCKQAKVPVFAFDHYAWNSRSSNENADG